MTWRGRVLLVVGIVAVGLVAYAGVSGARAWWAWRSIERVEFDPAAARAALATVTTTTAAPAPQATTTTTTQPVLSLDDRYEAFLAIGSDEKPDDEPNRQTGVYADAILLYLTPSDGGEPLLVSLPRDLYLTNPCTGTPAKLNSTISGCGTVISGPELVALTVEDYTGISIDHFALFGFEAFTDVIDSVGGVELCMEHALREGTVELLPQGCSVADGSTALRWLRSRTTQELVDGEWRFAEDVSDVARTERQQELMLALLAKLKAMRTPNAVADIATELGDAVVLDDRLSMGGAIALAWDLRSVAVIRRPRIPVEATVTADGSFALLPTMPFAEVIGES